MTISPEAPQLVPIMLRRELIAEGYDDRSLARALRTGLLARPRRGAYVDGAVWRSMTSEERYAVRARAVFRQSQTGVVLSHASALPFLGAPLWGLDLEEVHLTRTDERTGRREAGVRQHCGQLMRGDCIEAHGLVYTSPCRAALEVTTLRRTEPALAVVNHLLHERHVTMDELWARYDARMNRWPHTLSTGLILSLADGRIESVGETRTFYFFWRHRLPRPEPQLEVFDFDGTSLGRLDFALPELGVWFEFDGKVKYQKHLRPGESVVDAVLREKRREERIAEATGWRCFRITWADLADPVRLERRIRRFLAAVQRSRRPSR